MTEPELEALKHCPFCGGKCEFLKSPVRYFAITCSECGSGSQFYINKQQAIAAWNRRV